MKIAIAGTGYVGFFTAVCLVEHGCLVTCVDVDKKEIDSLNRYDKALIYEKNVDAMMEKNNERLYYTVDYTNAYKDEEIIFIGVGTTEKKDGLANLNCCPISFIYIKIRFNGYDAPKDKIYQ